MSVVLATAGYDHKIRFWEAPSGVCTKIIKFADSQINRLEITPDKQFIAAAGNPAVRLYEINSSSSSTNNNNNNSSGGSGGGNSNPAIGEGQHQHQQQAVLTLEGHTGNVTSLGFQKDGRYLYTGSEDGTIKIWDLRNPNYSRSFDVGAAVNSVCLRSDRDEFVSGDQNGFVKVWDLGMSNNNKAMVSIKPTLHEKKSTTTVSSAAAAKSSLSTTQNTTKKVIRNFEGIVPIQAVDVSEDSRTLVAVSNHGTVFVWDPSSSTSSSSTSNKSSQADHDDNNTECYYHLRPITKFRAYAAGTYCLHGKIAPDCRHLVTTASDGTATLWDTTTWELTQTLVHHNTTTTTTSNKNKQSPIISSNKTMTTMTKKGWVWDAAFCADSSYLVTACSDHVARLWNLRTGDVVRQYHGHQSAVTAVALNDSSV